ncbi:MAG: metallophosphoesterase family protein [Telluria sp.]|nr:metallophosphoesterase family protein [Telluria sp.]
MAVVRIGVISDTHGLLRPEAKAQLAGSDYIIHGGDIGNQAILDELDFIAPLTVVRGNNDRGPWAAAVPESAILSIGQLHIHVVHDIATLSIDPGNGDVHVVVFGHSHKPLVEQRSGILFVNPGSAGPRRFSLPITVAQLIIDGRHSDAKIINLLP